MPKYGPCFNKNLFGCVKCSIYDLKNSNSLIFEGLQTPHFTTIFEELFKNNAILCISKCLSYIGNIYGTTRIPKEGRFEEIYHLKHNAAQWARMRI